MTLDDFLKGTGKQYRTVVISRLNSLLRYRAPGGSKVSPGACSQMARNLRNDPRVTVPLWRKLCQTLKVTPNEPEKIRQTIVGWAQENGHALAGRVVKLKRVARYANCVSVDDFRQWLVDSGECADHRDARRTLREVLSRPDARAQASQLKAVRLKEYQMWATFHPCDEAEDPREWLPAAATGIRACLGLPRGDIGRDLLVIRYRLPSRVDPRFPTVATACANPLWSEYWRPTPKGERHGWTQPWPEWPDPKGKSKAPKPYACPEVVHEPITGATLTDKLVKLTP